MEHEMMALILLALIGTLTVTAFALGTLFGLACGLLIGAQEAERSGGHE